jgi:hypothetical protein
MATTLTLGQSPAVRRRKLENDFQASLVFVVAGLVLLVLWGIVALTNLFPSVSGSTLWVAFAGLGTTFLLVGTVCVAINWVLVQRLGPLAPA